MKQHSRWLTILYWNTEIHNTCIFIFQPNPSVVGILSLTLHDILELVRQSSMNCHISQEISPGNKYMYIIHVIREVLNHRICSKFVTHIEFSMETCMHHWSPDINPSYEYFLAVHKINPEPDLWEKTLAVDWIINRQPVYRCHKLRQ